MHSFTAGRKLFLIAALVFLFEFVLGTIVALQLNLSDASVGSSVREHWMTNGTPITAPLVFMVPMPSSWCWPFARGGQLRCSCSPLRLLSCPAS
jgi:hypothetical protein